MSEITESEENCRCDYESENEHFQIHLIQEFMNLNKQIGQSNMLAIESHNLMKEQISAMKEQTLAHSLSIAAITICILACFSRSS